MIVSEDVRVGYRVEVVTSCVLIEPEAWDRVVIAADGDVFHSHAWHMAVEEAPPGRMEPAHLVAYHRDELVGICPAYLVRECPRLGYVFSDELSPVLLSHGLAALTGGPLVLPGHERAAFALDEGISRTARDLGAWAHGYANLTPGRFCGWLLGRGYAMAEVATGYRLINQWDSADAYWASLRRRHRQTLRRERAREIGHYSVRQEPPSPDEAIRLVHALLVDRGTPVDVLPEPFLGAVLRRLAPYERAIVARDPGGTARAVFLGWRFGRKVAMWVAGLDAKRLRVFEPYHAMMAAAAESMIAERASCLDLGRANGTVKRRYGARPVPLSIALRSGHRDRDALLHLWCRDLQRHSNAVLNGLETSSRCC